MKPTQELLDKIATALLASRGFGFCTDPAEGGQDAYDLTLQALEEARAVAAILPDNLGLDFVRLMETWTEDSVNLTATLLDMAISATMLKYRPGLIGGFEELTITSADLRTIAEQYHWERREEAGSWTIRLQKISEMSSEAVDTQ